MECLRCGAKLKDNALVCKKCGFIVKGAKKLENVEPSISFEEKINNASAEELRAMILAYKKAKEAPKETPKDVKKISREEKKVEKEEIDPEKLTIKKGKKWATASFICGLSALVLMLVPGINVIATLMLFFVAFIGFGQCNGQRSTLALIGVILAIVAIGGSWAYNSYLAPTIGEMLGLTGSVVQEGAEAIVDADSVVTY